MLSNIEIMLIVSSKIGILWRDIMQDKIKHINTIIRRLKTNDIASIQYIDKLENNTLFSLFPHVLSEKQLFLIPNSLITGIRC